MRPTLMPSDRAAVLAGESEGTVDPLSMQVDVGIMDLLVWMAVANL